MRKILKLLCMSIIIALTFASCSCVGESEKGDSAENQKSYKEVVDEFFDAVDDRDNEDVKELFSEYAQEKDKDLDKQIEKLFEVYSGPTTKWYYDEMLSGEFVSDSESKESAVSSVFPVVSQGKYYWCSVEWVQSNENDSSREGIKEISFYTAEDYYVFCEEFREYENKVGLAVYAEEKLDFYVCCIGSQPYKYNPNARILNRSEVEGVLRVNRKYADFRKRFGEPRADYTTINCFYELFEENGEKRYVSLTVDEDSGEIVKAEVMSNFSQVSTILDNAKRETQSTEVQNIVE